MRRVLYYLGRGLQVLGMWLLLVDLVTAGSMGPNPKLFALGVGVFIAGWWAVRAASPKSS